MTSVARNVPSSLAARPGPFLHRTTEFTKDYRVSCMVQMDQNVKQNYNQLNMMHLQRPSNNYH